MTDRLITLLFASLSLLMVGCATTVQPMRVDEKWPIGKQHFKHVLVIVLENQDYDWVFAAGTKAAAVFGRLAEQGTLFTRYEGIRHPSYPNYIGLVAGNTRYFLPGLLGDLTHDRDEPSVADLLENNHQSLQLAPNDPR
jgi:hypothetical protein